MRTDSRGQFLAGHSRHHLIEEYNVVRLSAVPGALELRKAVESVSRSRGRDAVCAKLATEDLEIHREIVDHQHLQFFQLAGQRPHVRQLRGGSGQ